MAWSSLTTPFDWQDVDFVNEFVSAQRERQDALGATNSALKVAGDDIQSASFWSGLQNWCLTESANFIATKDAVGTAIVNYHGEPTLTLWPLADFKFNIASNAGGFRRYTVHPDDGGTPSYGTMQAGDYVGDWLFADLQAAFNLLVWTRRHLFGTEIDWTGNTVRSGKSTLGQVWEDMKVEAEDDYDDGPEVSGGGISALTSGIQKEFSDPKLYLATMSRQKAKLEVYLPDAGLAFEVDFYPFVTKTNLAVGVHDVFDANGDFTGVNEDEYWLGNTKAFVASTTTATGDYIGDVAASNVPTWCAEPLVGGASTARGYTTDSLGAVVRWNVVNGMEYVP